MLLSYKSKTVTQRGAISEEKSQKTRRTTNGDSLIPANPIRTGKWNCRTTGTISKANDPKDTKIHAGQGYSELEMELSQKPTVTVSRKASPETKSNNSQYR